MSFRFTGCCCWRPLAVDGGSGTSRDTPTSGLTRRVGQADVRLDVPVPFRLARQGARPSRAAFVSGWSAPRPRSQSASVRSSSGIASAVRPQPDRPSRGCSALSGCPGGQCPAPARSRRAPAQAAGSPRPSPRSPVGHREVVPPPKGVRVVSAPHPLAVGNRPPCGIASTPAAFRLSGWSAPSTHSNSGAKIVINEPPTLHPAKRSRRGEAG